MNIKKNIPLASYITFNIGGPADYFVIASTMDEIIEAVSWARERGMPFFMLGQGANILVGDKGFRGLVIKNEAKKVLRITNHESRITDIVLAAESGITISELIEKTAEMGLSGLEHFAGIPSSLGGALWQNLHFLSADRSKAVFIGELVENAEVLRITNYESRITEKQVVDKSYFNFGYDYSSLHDTKDVVLSVTLVLKKERKELIQETIEKNLAWRAEKHPADAAKKSAGSVFKKIEHHGAGRLIEKAGLKGYRIGGAEISSQHANFIINTGTATAKDVRELISLAQTKVKEMTGLQLETEISFVGEF